MKRCTYLYSMLLFCCSPLAFADTDSTLRATKTTQDALYARPFLTSLSSMTSVGGYTEANANYIRTDGLSEGLSMEMRRFNIFLYSAISSRLKVLAELEFEHGTEEISIETAQLDFVIDPALVVRGGILLAPLGAFNQRHDGPLYEFVDRPMVATRIIPSTLSLMGFGVNGKIFFADQYVLTYDACLTNGLHDGIILNGEQRTSLAGGKSNALFEGSNNGIPAILGRLALRHRTLGELGLSAYNGVYNSFLNEGIAIDSKQSLQMLAVDYSLDIASLHIQGETALNLIDVPSNLRDIYGARQWGTYLEAIAPLTTFAMAEYSSVVVNLGLRAEYVDCNSGTFRTGGTIYDDEASVTLSLSMRPTQETVLRCNYRRSRVLDLVGNPSNVAALLFGFATYF